MGQVGFGKLAFGLGTTAKAKPAAFRQLSRVHVASDAIRRPETKNTCEEIEEIDLNRLWVGCFGWTHFDGRSSKNLWLDIAWWKMGGQWGASEAPVRLVRLVRLVIVPLGLRSVSNHGELSWMGVDRNSQKNNMSIFWAMCSSVHDPNSQKWDVDKKNGSNGRPGMIKSNKNWSWKKVTKLNMSKNNPVFFVRDKYSEPNNQQDHLNATHPGRSHLFLAMMMLCRWMRFITPWKQKDWKALCGHLESDDEVAHWLTSAHTGSHMRTCLPVICVDEPCTRKGTINESMTKYECFPFATCGLATAPSIP